MGTPATSYPLDYLDKGCLAATNRERGGSCAPVWEFEVDGEVDPATLSRALAKTFACYPTARSQVVAEGTFPDVKELNYVPIDDFDIDDVFTVVEVPPNDDQALEELRQTIWDNFLDVFERPPVAIILARLGPGRSHLFFQQHHCVADGRAFIGWLSDLTRFLNDEASPIALRPRATEVEVLKLSRLKAMWWRFLGTLHVAGAIIGGLVRPLRPMLHNLSDDITGSNRVRCVRVDDARLADWKAKAKAEAVSLNSLLVALLLNTLSKWSADHGVPAGKTNCHIVAETRPRDGSVVSFANHLGGFVVTYRLKKPHELGDLARRINGDVRRQARKNLHIKKLLAERGVALGMTMRAMMKLVWDAKRPALNIGLSNLIPLDFPALRGPQWTAKRVRICTPVLPWGAVAPTVVRYGGEVCFNFNYVTSAIEPALVEDLADRFRHALEALSAGALPE